MGKRIMIVNGSPRKHGNSAVLSGWIADGAREKGASVELVNAAELDYKALGCTACMGCQESDEYRCIIKDEVSGIIAKMAQMDVVLFATPVYFFSFSAQLKLVVDRMFSHFKFSKDKIINDLDKTNFALLASANGDLGSGLEAVDNNMREIAGFVGRKHKSLLVPFAPHDPNETAMNRALQEEAMSFGAELAEW